MIKIEYIDKKEFEKNATFIKPSKALAELHEQSLRHRKRYEDSIKK